jgi:hypothetical protein
MWRGLNIFLWSYLLPLSMCMTLGNRKFLGLWINEILQRTVRSIGTVMVKVRMDLESITLYLNKKHLSAVAIHPEINSILGEGHDLIFNCHSLLAEAKFCKCFAPGPIGAWSRGGWHNWQCYYHAAEWEHIAVLYSLSLRKLYAIASLVNINSFWKMSSGRQTLHLQWSTPNIW